MEVDGKWMVLAAKLYSALTSFVLVHTPSCDESKCEVCRNGSEARQAFRELNKEENKKLDLLRADWHRTDRE